MWGLFVASPPLCNRCFSRVRQRQSACCCREKIRRTPSGAGKISPSICVTPLHPRPPLLVSRPLLQSGKRHQRRRAASSAAQPADPSKVTATSGSTSSAPARLPLARGACSRLAASWGAPRPRSTVIGGAGRGRGRCIRQEAEAPLDAPSLPPACAGTPEGFAPASPHHSSP